MKRITSVVDTLDVQFLAAVLALLGLAIGVALVFSAGWGLIVMCVLILVYVILPDQRSQS